MSMTAKEYREALREHSNARIRFWARLIVILVFGAGLIYLASAYVQGGLDKNQKSMDDAVKFMQRGRE